MKFLGDIPISRQTLQHLQNQGHDVVAAGERLAPTASDAELIRLAASEGRVILCFDLGFAELVALSGEKLPSLITFRTTRQQPEFINRRLDDVLPGIAEELERGALATVEDHRVRVRPLLIVRAPPED